MGTHNPPCLLPCRQHREEYGLRLADFTDVFTYLYAGQAWWLDWPKRGAHRVRFRDSDFAHVFFKGTDSDPGNRHIWKPDRAERILWIGYTIENYAELWRENSSDVLAFCPMPQSPWSFFVVVMVEQPNQYLDFKTAYPADRKYYDNKRLSCKRIAVART